MVVKTLIAALLAAVASVSVPNAAAATDPRPIRIFEEAAESFWEVPHACADGSTVLGTLLVRTTRFYEAPATEDPDPTARLQFLAVCPGGFSFSWGAPVVPATIFSTDNLRLVLASGAGTARDLLGRTHQVTFEVAYVGVGPLETSGGPSNTRKEREAIAFGRMTFDGAVLVASRNNHSTRPAPFIRVDLEF